MFMLRPTQETWRVSPSGTHGWSSLVCVCSSCCEAAKPEALDLNNPVSKLRRVFSLHLHHHSCLINVQLFVWSIFFPRSFRKRLTLLLWQLFAVAAEGLDPLRPPYTRFLSYTFILYIFSFKKSTVSTNQGTLKADVRSPLCGWKVLTMFISFLGDKWEKYWR